MYYFIVLLSLISIVNGCERKVIWQSDFCLATQALVDNTVLPPRSSNCQFYIEDSLSFVKNISTQYENVYQVDTEAEMMDCDASNPVNTGALVFNETSTLSLVISSDFQFTLTKIVYLISTSSGSEYSALNDRTRNTSCLQMSFSLLSSTNKDCTQQTVCKPSVLNDSSILNLGCNFGIFSFPNTETTQTSTDTSLPTTISNDASTNSESITPGIPTTTDNVPPVITQQSSTQCISPSFKLSNNFCLDWILFPLMFLIVLVSVLIVFACSLLCFKKGWLCFSYCRRNVIKDSDLYQAPHTREQGKKSRNDYKNMELENVRKNSETQEPSGQTNGEQFNATTPPNAIGNGGTYTPAEFQDPSIQAIRPAPPPPFGSDGLPPLRVKPIKVIGNSPEYENN